MDILEPLELPVIKIEIPHFDRIREGLGVGLIIHIHIPEGSAN
jgi:hypothetical protein